MKIRHYASFTTPSAPVVWADKGHNKNDVRMNITPTTIDLNKRISNMLY